MPAINQQQSMLRYTCAGPKGLVRRNTTSTAFAAPTDKRGFVMSRILEQAYLRAPVQWFWGMVGATRKGVRTAVDVFLTTMLHPVRVETQRMVLLNPTGTKTMTATTTATSASTPKQGTPDPIQLHATAHNALSMALHYLHQPQANPAAARRKAVQALAALRVLSLALEA